jgi:hypothetical protein
VRLGLTAPDPDLQEMVERSTTELQAMNAGLGLLMWGIKVFGREESTTYDPSQWRRRLQDARTAAGDGIPDEQDLGRSGPGFLAAVCVRDHWEEMSGDERDWCVTVVCAEVEREGDQWNQHARVQRNAMSADRPCAWVLPLLLRTPLEDVQRSRVQRVFVVALTHAIDEVRWYAASGMGRHLWAIDRDVALRCVNALATEAILVQHMADAEYRRPHPEREFSHPHIERRGIDEIEAEAAATVRQKFFEPDGISGDAYEILNPSEWFGAEANGRILAILGQAPTEPVAIAAFGRLAHTLTAWWDADDDRRRVHREPRRERNYQIEAALRDHLQSFLLRTAAAPARTILQPILDAVDRHPREAHRILQGLIAVEDRQPNTPQFWSLWELFADRVRRAKWLTGIEGEYPSGDEMVSAIFLGPWWKEEVRHWRSLEGHAEHIHALFEDLPASSAVLEDYLRFLYHIGEQSLPDVFLRIAKRLQQGNPAQMLRKGNTVFLLEVLLLRYVYGRPLELKRRGDLRGAVLVLLDVLVENGSSAAFRMRDDFVTPVPSPSEAASHGE